MAEQPTSYEQRHDGASESNPFHRRASNTTSELTSNPRGSSSTEEQPPREELVRPTLSIVDGLQWKERKKNGRPVDLPGYENLASLNKRDHIFLVDNSDTMEQYRGDIAGVVSLLAYLVKGSNDDGLDLYFTQNTKKINSKRSREISNKVYNQEFGGIADMRGRLGSILGEHTNRFGTQISSQSLNLIRKSQSPRQEPKPLSFYILTDARWQPGDVGEVIKDVVQKMEAKGLPKEHVGIQFIRFGKDLASIQKLDGLGHGLGLSM
ncbi:MAG: hypothetical protein LQ344_007087 [Seirophora lacunosa]|nr:MAG: hypothetical protein LQ344_007087 [Seirophora lacunosa]